MQKRIKRGQIVNYLYSVGRLCRHCGLNTGPPDNLDRSRTSVWRLEAVLADVFICPQMRFALTLPAEL